MYLFVNQKFFNRRLQPISDSEINLVDHSNLLKYWNRID